MIVDCMNIRVHDIYTIKAIMFALHECYMLHVIATCKLQNKFVFRLLSSHPIVMLEILYFLQHMY